MATLLAAHARPPGYMFFFPLYESRNLADKIHVEEWNPEIHVAVGLAIRLGTNRILFFLFFFKISYY